MIDESSPILKEVFEKWVCMSEGERYSVLWGYLKPRGFFPQEVVKLFDRWGREKMYKEEEGKSKLVALKQPEPEPEPPKPKQPVKEESVKAEMQFKEKYVPLKRYKPSWKRKDKFFAFRIEKWLFDSLQPNPAKKIRSILYDNVDVGEGV